MVKQLCSTFGHKSSIMRSDYPIPAETMRAVAPSIFAVEPHESRSSRYTYIPTIEVLNGLKKEGFEPFMVCQSKCRLIDKREYTKHMIRLRHATSIAAREANEVILINSHDGTSSYQMLAGMLVFVCQNGLVTGTINDDIRVRHGGDIMQNVIEGAYTVLDNFKTIEAQRDSFKGITLNHDEQRVFATAALALKYDPEDGTPPVRPEQLVRARRVADAGDSLWSVFNRAQENMIAGGLHGRTGDNRRTTTRAVQGIDQNVKLNRGLWILAESMRQLKEAA